MKKHIILGCLFALFIACKQKEDNKASKASEQKIVENEAFDKFLEDYYQRVLKLSPLNATFAGDNRYNDKFANVLEESYLQEVTTFFKEQLVQVIAFDERKLNAEQVRSKKVLIWDLEGLIADSKYGKKYTPIDQMWTLQLSFGQLASGAGAQPFKTVKDYQNWLKRVDGYLDWMETAQKRMLEGITKGYVLPKALIVKVIPQLEAMTKLPVEEHLFYGPIKQLPADFNEADKEELVASYKNMITDKVVPAYRKLHKFMATTYLAKGRSSSGISAIPNGREYYQHQIKKYTTTEMTADQIHQIGLQEVARIRSEMEKVKKQVGFDGDLKAFFDFVRNNKELMPYKTPEEVIANFNAIHDKMKPLVDALFTLQPKTAFEVRRTEAFREASASAEYNQGSLDGTRPGIFYTPIPDAAKYNVFQDEALFLHEAIPGHHFQISLQQENTALPSFRKTLWYSAYGEGWALYTESLGKELGLYTDPYQYFGMLGMEMHRAIRLVVDTAIHAKGWTREQAIQYSLDNEAESEASIVSEIERYMANPGQALSYKIGQIKIRELREEAEKKMGDSFNLAEFHTQVLQTGCVPLAILEEEILKWVNK